LVDEVVDGPVRPRAIALARELAARPPRAVSHVKRLVRMAAGQGLAAGLAAERTLFCDLMVDAESIDAMARMNAGETTITG
jgi:enoyl-CoA hydratase/carnithine racemase